jgi:hypothetical protein
MRGSANFEVLGDGHKLLWQSGVMRGGQAPKTVDLDLTGVQQIILRVTTAGDGYEYDHADWADARFTVTGARPQTADWKPTVTEPVIAMPAPTPRPQLHPPAIVGIRTGTPFLWTPPVTGDRPLKFAAKGLPSGITLEAATGTLSGTVAKEGDYPVQITVQNSAGRDIRTIHLMAGPILAATPPMGWNSYDCFGDSVTEEETLANARYVAAHLLPYGWDTIVVDYRWYDAFAHDNNAGNKPFAPLTMDASGRLLPAPNRFPSAADGHGFKALADKVHALGLKFGIHIMRGIPRNAVKANTPIDGSNFTATEAANTQDTCPWCPDMYGVRGGAPAGQAYYDSLFRLYASWGVDIVKMDDTSSPYHTDEIEAVHSAIAKCGRSIVYSLSPGETPVEDGKHVATHANMWRGLGDLWDNWNQLNHAFEVGARWTAFVGPGHWPDPDMLPLGRLSVGNRSVGNGADDSALALVDPARSAHGRRGSARQRSLDAGASHQSGRIGCRSGRPRRARQADLHAGRVAGLVQTPRRRLPRHRPVQPQRLRRDDHRLRRRSGAVRTLHLSRPLAAQRPGRFSRSSYRHRPLARSRAVPLPDCKALAVRHPVEILCLFAESPVTWRGRVQPV